MPADFFDRIMGKKRLIAIAALAAVLMVMLFSSFFIIKEADHECSHASCATCSMIEMCEENIRQLGAGSLLVVFVAAIFAVFRQEVCLTEFALTSESLITRKVRLND